MTLDPAADAPPNDLRRVAVEAERVCRRVGDVEEDVPKRNLVARGRTGEPPGAVDGRDAGLIHETPDLLTLDAFGECSKHQGVMNVR